MRDVHKIVRRGKSVYVMDQLENEELICTSPTVDMASWTASCIAGWHKVSLQEWEADES